MKIKINDLTTRQLNWAVAKALGIEVKVERMGLWLQSDNHQLVGKLWSPATEWAQGGAIIESAIITLDYAPDTKLWSAQIWDTDGNERAWGVDPLPLIAAMRAFVMSKREATVTVPEHLL